MQTALSQMDQGIAVFDSSNHLTIWNRRASGSCSICPRHPARSGFRSRRYRRHPQPARRCPGLRGQPDGPAFPDAGQTLRALVLGREERIMEVRSNAMPDKGIVATFTDITQRVAADQALKQPARRWSSGWRSAHAELTRVNHELGEARASADEADLGKTRFFAAAARHPAAA